MKREKPDVIKILERLQYENAQLKEALRKSMRYVQELDEMFSDTDDSNTQKEIRTFIETAKKLKLYHDNGNFSKSDVTNIITNVGNEKL